jgi:hypothetical protein
VPCVNRVAIGRGRLSARASGDIPFRDLNNVIASTATVAVLPFRKGMCEDLAGDVHLAQQQPAEDIAVLNGIGRYAERAYRQRSARFALASRRLA